MTSSNSLTHLLENTTVSELLSHSPAKELITIQSDLSAKDACAVLSSNRISSAVYILAYSKR
jgi:CBS domain-containing protein